MPAATSSGWATAVSRIVSASDSVPWRSRSMPAARRASPALLDAGQLAPRGQEAGLLRPLAGADDREHRYLQGRDGDGPLGDETGRGGGERPSGRPHAEGRPDGGDQDSPPNEPDSPAFTFVRSYLSMAWRTTEGSTLPSLASSWRVLTTIECASIFR